MRENDLLTTQDYWETAQSKQPRMRLPSSWNVSTRDTKRLLRSYVKPGMELIEIGCAPGKMLSYCAAELRARVAGIDYSRTGMQHARELFETLHLLADLRCEDMFAHSFSRNSFDLVYSLGVIEHFEDPLPVVEIHTQLLKPGGVAIITIPNYGGLYGRLEKHFNSQDLAMHNLEIMNTTALRRMLAHDRRYRVRSWAAGKFSPWLISFHRKLPRVIAHITAIGLNFAGLVQPFEVDCLCPSLVLEITRVQDERMLK
jgi:2-polyprenyl-3-methyl-5-hydroxy-6-metoxy-1,4-benzoquinol methylase